MQRMIIWRTRAAHWCVGLAVAALMVMPNASHAASYEAQRAALISQIEQLLQQLILLEMRQNSNYYYLTPVVTSPEPMSGRSRVEVETLSAIDVEDDEAEVYANVDLSTASYAYVWFEYGEDDDDLDERTGRARIDRDDRSTVMAELDDLQEDERYYYRAVARDPEGRVDYGRTRSFTTDEAGSGRYDDEEPEVDTFRARDINEDSAELGGEVDMNDYRNGRVFFVYGEDEDQVADIEYDYDEYRDIDEDGDDLQKLSVDSDLDGDAEYEGYIWGLDDDTEHYYQICVEFEDDDDDSVIICGGVEEFETDRD